MNAKSGNFFIYFLISIIAVFFGVILGATYQQNRENGNHNLFPSLALKNDEKLDKILRVIKSNYVDSVNTDSLQDLAINDILSSLDPHTIYLPPIQAKSQNESLEGNFEGIGIEYFVLSDTLFVTHVRENGPSAVAGLKKGDKIIAVNGESLVKKGSSTEFVNKLRGKSGSKVNVSILRTSKQKPLSIDIVRAKIVVSSIDVAFMIKPAVGFIKISRFGANTAEDFATELTDLQKAGMKSLILDLRGNGGGYLNAATALADQFLADNQLIVYTKGLHEPRTDYKATSDGMFEKGMLIVLIDEGTASASEILAGAIQDLDRGLVIGRRSFGKGLVQEQFGFGDGSAMNLTIARYYTPSGRSIQKSYSKGKDAYKEEINHRYEHGDYSSLDSALSDSTFISPQQKFKTSKGKIVYGGGGIMPDVFIPMDTSKYTPLYQKIMMGSLIPEFVYGRLTNTVNISQFKTLKDYKEKFHFSTPDYQAFLSYCKSRNIPINLKEAEISKPLIVNQIKAMLGRYYYGEAGFYTVFTDNDDFVNTALSKIKKPA